MDTEFSKNRAMLNRCNKMYTRLAIAYAFVLLVFPIASLMISFATIISHDSIFLIIDSIVMFPPMIWFAWKAVYAKRDLPAMGIIAFMVINQIILGISRHYVSGKWMNGLWTFKSVEYCFWINLGVGIVLTVIAAINLATNIKYHWLEEQYGFPHFNERFQQQCDDKQQREILDQFQQEVNRLKKTATDEMPELGKAQGELEKYVPVHIPSDMQGIGGADDTDNDDSQPPQ